MSSKILFIFEGIKTEKQIFASLCKHILCETINDAVVCVFGAEIYQLYSQILKEDEDEAEFVDVVEILKQRELQRGEDTLKNSSRKEFDEIFLFFDYDGHAIGADDKKIAELLTYFDNETDNGRLFISYPMVEALKHLNEISLKERSVKCKEKINYKDLVQTESKHPYIDITRYTKDVWSKIINEHLCKMNYIVSDDYTFPSSIMMQDVIFNKQLSKFITPSSTVSVLSPFPIFIYDYFGSQQTLQIIQPSNKD